MTTSYAARRSGWVAVGCLVAGFALGSWGRDVTDVLSAILLTVSGVASIFYGAARADLLALAWTVVSWAAVVIALQAIDFVFAPELPDEGETVGPAILLFLVPLPLTLVGLGVLVANVRRKTWVPRFCRPAALSQRR